MEKCPFWSTNDNEILCNNECPMHKLEGTCSFQLLFGSDNIETLNEFEELNYIIN